MAITIKDIAKECDVSITAVSFVLNGKDDLVSEKTKEKILNTCKKYNYKPNYLASALKSKTTNYWCSYSRFRKRILHSYS